jgi:hypothetical protein
MLHEASHLPSNELESMLALYPFHATVFVLPPWELIYTNDADATNRLLRRLTSTPGSSVGTVRAATFSVKNPAFL